MSALKVRPCKLACGYPAAKGRQFCAWHILKRSSSDDQAQAAQGRREAARQSLGGEFPRARVPKASWPDGERWCAGCQSFVPLFYTSGSRCKGCSLQASHERRVEKVYGITAEEYDRILAEQGGGCGICGNKPRTVRFAVDHDHKTGEVRGILCKRCNHDLLGGGHDSIEGLWRGIVYLVSPPAQRVEGFRISFNHVSGIVYRAVLDREIQKAYEAGNCLTEEQAQRVQEVSHGARHNHVTRDIREPGLCPACDAYHARHPLP